MVPSLHPPALPAHSAFPGLRAWLDTASLTPITMGVVTEELGNNLEEQKADALGANFHQ